ncbi:uncharacterized protein F4822DRAFT_430025 [Hypoxylon trugodes]|uniref:uncharacterized protein n=1 Tax=Hypoxylon trugodes TaxID=326681 RepID=UPI002194ADAF|nr:uncharacterized protein F4822DRAFT_430025 [Hypoxylon trugodes]KAI1387273.1 hypothetical protein F4822DRAFT_430025 [Hypoxylon trugodes]
MNTAPIAVIGFSFKLPQNVEDDNSFWDMLEKRKNLMTDWPRSRVSIDSIYDSESTGPNVLRSRGGHFLAEDPTAFDAPFFAITPAEASAMDPQQRLVLESSYHALENAGIPMENLNGSLTAVFAASFTTDFAHLHAKDPDSAPRAIATGTASTMLPNRVSWYFNLQGPSIHVDTACSSSLTALDMACQSLRSEDASMAFVIGSNLLLSPEHSLHFSSVNLLSPDSVCYSFDHRANGYGRGEGIVALLLKPLSAALNDGDMIRAVIRATGSNQDGRTPTINHPSADAQERLIRRVYKKAGLGFGATRYVEAHGTGTPTGDPIEVEAISRVFKTYQSRQQPLFMYGSVKSNMGHLEGASGLVGAVKAILALEKGMIPANALFEKLNPRIEEYSDHITILTTNTLWPSQGVRRASVNSFGLGGSNTHVILDDAMSYFEGHGILGAHNCTSHPELVGSPRWGREGEVATSPKIFVWTAASEDAINRLVQSYGLYYRTDIANDSEKLDRLAYTLSNRRSIMPWRTFAILGGDSVDKASIPEQLPVVKPCRASASIGAAFIFTGQGAQYAHMGSGLLRYTVFREALERADEAFKQLGCPWSVFEVIENKEIINLPEYSQPICTALQIALVELLKSFGVTPVAVVGHSSGEIAAAYVIGALSLQSACKVSYFRGKLVSELCRSTSNPGAMMSVGLSKDHIPIYLDKVNPSIPKDEIHISCINSPTNCTVSATESLIDQLKTKLELDGVFAQKLNTGVSYHSPAMEEIADRYKELMGSLQINVGCDPAAIMVSSVTGELISPEILSKAQYWVDNLVSPVRFADAVITLMQQWVEPLTNMIEIGPHSTLRRPVRDAVNSISQSIRYHTVLNRSKPSIISTLELAGTFTKPPRILVDCPKYPFDHSRIYWEEPRFARDFRLRGGTSGRILGRRVYDWNPLAPRWRVLLSLEYFPWLEDHTIGNMTLLPGAAMLVMAVEAVQEISAKSEEISGFFIKEAQFLSPIVIEEAANGTTEASLHLHRLQQPHEKDSNLFEITIFSYRKNIWDKCFKAIIESQYQVDADENREAQSEKDAILQRFDVSANPNAATIELSAFYSFLEKTAIKYGRSFRLLQDIRWNGPGSSTARIDVSAHKGRDIVQPPVLDAAIHIALLDASKGLFESPPSLVPQKLSNTWISAKGWDCIQAPSIRVLSESKMQGSSFEAMIHVLGDDNAPLCSMECLVMAPVTSQTNASENEHRKLLHNIEWKPQLSSLDPHQLQDFCDSASSDTINVDAASVSELYQNIELAMVTAAHKVLQDLKWPEEPLDKPRHLSKLVSTIRYLYRLHYKSEGAGEMSDEAINTTWKSLETFKPGWKIFPAIIDNLKGILYGEIDPLQVLFTEGYAETFYSSIFSDLCSEKFRRFVDVLSHENSGLRILEIGAGTGGLTQHVLSAFQALEEQTGTSRISEYVYTDISSAFFENARSKFQHFAGRISFMKLDIERNIEGQGLDLSDGYDVIIAGSVLHIATDLSTALQNIYRALRPGGYLINAESTIPESAAANIGFGVLPGWWQANEDWRAHSPLLKESQWEKILRDTGFSKNLLTLRDSGSDLYHIFSLMVSTKPSPREGISGRQPIVVSNNSKEQYALATTMRHALGAITMPLDRLHPERITTEDIVVVNLDIGKPFLANMSDTEFYAIQELVKAAKNLVWITATGIEEPNYPHYQATTGFIRTLRSESFDRRYVTLLIESTPPQTPEQIVGHIEKVFEVLSRETSSSELEFIVRDSCLNIGRLVEGPSLNEELRSLATPRLREESFGSIPAVKLSTKANGPLETFQFMEDLTYDAPLSPNEVKIKANAWALSFRDLFIALGRLPKGGMGYECSGVVTRIGTDVALAASLQIGDRVVLCSTGGMRTYPRADVQDVFKIPEGISFEDSIAAITPGITAYHSLINVARIQEGESILIHSGAGSTGQIAIWIAKMIGANIFVTVGSDQKKQLLIDGFDIPEGHIFNSRRPSSFAKGILRATAGRGVDVILNSLSGAGLRASWECIAPHGRFVEIGKTDIMANSSLPMSNFARNASFFAVDIFHISQSNPTLMRALTSHVRNLLAGGNIRNPTPLHCYPASDVEGAFRFMQSGANTGRIIIKANESDVIPTFRRRQTAWTFDPNASYLVAGGLGGLGRVIIKWMAKKGAKHLILPSRSGIKTQAAHDVVAELKENGVSVMTPKCDISVSSLTAVLAECAHTMPPIKGCINAAMALQDSTFENMSYGQWKRTIQSKIDTSWNLHKLLPRSMDFFVLLSSLSGFLGSASQANYAAGCTFQDSLARYRTSHREKAISIDVGWMRTIGIVAETKEYRRVRNVARDMWPIEEEEILSLLDLCCDPSLPVLSPDKSQRLIGTKTPLDFIAQGEDPIPAVSTPMFAAFRSTRNVSQAGSKRGLSNDGALFKQATDSPERIAIVVRAIRSRLSTALSIALDDVDTDKTLFDYGIDSLTAVEFRNWIGREFHANLTVLDIMGKANILEIGRVVAERTSLAS